MVPLLSEGVAAFSVVELEFVVVLVLDAESSEHPIREVSNKTATEVGIRNAIGSLRCQLVK